MLLKMYIAGHRRGIMKLVMKPNGIGRPKEEEEVVMKPNVIGRPKEEEEVVMKPNVIGRPKEEEEVVMKLNVIGRPKEEEVDVVSGGEVLGDDTTSSTPEAVVSSEAIVGTVMTVNERWRLHVAQYRETDSAIELLGTTYKVRFTTIGVYTKSILMSVPQAVTYDGYNQQPTEVVSVFLCSCLYVYRYHYSQ
jgi:hypothetical protein